MNAFEILFIAAALAGLIAWLVILAMKQTSGNVLAAAMLSSGFAAYTGLQIWREGIAQFWVNHTQDLTGVQVWWDLIMCALLALFFMAPRARKVGMNVPLWAVFAGCTASIGLLAMAARIFWLEQAAQSDAV